MKYLVLFVVVIVGLMLFKKSQQQRSAPGVRKSTQLPAPEPMHACRHCGVHVPQCRCVWKGDKPYCCSDHARLG